MELNEFRTDIAERVRLWAEADRNFKRPAFVECCTRMLEDAEEISDFEHCYHRGVGSKNRNYEVDGYSFDDADGSARIFLAGVAPISTGHPANDRR